MPDSLVVGVVSEADPNDHTNPTTRLLRLVRDAAHEASQRYPSRVQLQFVISVPGPTFKPSVGGVKLGGFSRAKNRLSVSIDIPEGLTTPLDEFLAGALQEGLRLTEDYLRRKQLIDSIEPINQAAAEVMQTLTRGSTGG